MDTRKRDRDMADRQPATQVDIQTDRQGGRGIQTERQPARQREKERENLMFDRSRERQVVKVGPVCSRERGKAGQYVPVCWKID